MSLLRRRRKKDQDSIVNKPQTVSKTEDQVQHAAPDMSAVSPSDVLHLQRTIGNRAAEQFIQDRSAGQAQPVQRTPEEEEEPECPGSEIRSGGEGRGEGVGEGRGPLGVPVGEEERE